MDQIDVYMSCMSTARKPPFQSVKACIAAARPTVWGRPSGSGSEAKALAVRRWARPACVDAAACARRVRERVCVCEREKQLVRWKGGEIERGGKESEKKELGRRGLRKRQSSTAEER
eukprot:5322866-Pleurochrysis_carterae.AAC.2